MIHYYLQKGFKPKEIINLTSLELEFYTQSMIIQLEDEAKTGA